MLEDTGAVNQRIQEILGEVEAEKESQKYAGQEFILGRQLVAKWVAAASISQLGSDCCCPLVFVKPEAP